VVLPGALAYVGSSTGRGTASWYRLVHLFSDTLPMSPARRESKSARRQDSIRFHETLRGVGSAFDSRRLHTPLLSGTDRVQRVGHCTASKSRPQGRAEATAGGARSARPLDNVSGRVDADHLHPAFTFFVMGQTVRSSNKLWSSSICIHTASGIAEGPQGCSSQVTPTTPRIRPVPTRQILTVGLPFQTDTRPRRWKHAPLEVRPGRARWIGAPWLTSLSGQH